MTTARHQQVCLDVTPWYHCTTNCVRRAFICGYDALTKRDFSHRRRWIEERILLLTDVFCIDVGAYAIMSNHYHIVLKVNRDVAMAHSDQEIVKRWLTLYSGNEIAQRFNKGESLSEPEINALKASTKTWRNELANISRFMAEINQNIARRANSEDGIKGKFWQARFDSQAILDDDALIRTLVYVDLNPVRAKIAKTPENSVHTSIRRRLNEPQSGLIPFQREETAHPVASEQCLPIQIEDYLTLLDWTSRQIRDDKRGNVSHDAPDIFQRLAYSSEQWLCTLQPKVTWKQKALGSVERISDYCRSVKQKWIWQAPDHGIHT